MTTEDIPAVVAITPISKDGWMRLKKVVRTRLGLRRLDALRLDMRDEIILTIQETGCEKIVEQRGLKIRLPDKALIKLGISARAITERAYVALVERKAGLAVKRLHLVERKSNLATVVDYETTYEITRVAETNPMPDELISQLSIQCKDFSLTYDVTAFLKGKKTYEAWKARQILGILDPSDEALRRELIRTRLMKQREEGSWDGMIPVTARILRELADLGVTNDNDMLQRAANWLLSQPESMHNPGMFLLNEELVTEQARLIRSRQLQQRGKKERFRQLKASEKKLIRAADNQILNPCGPRIMWPNALVLEALLTLGYEEHERIQTALRTMLTGRDWCECGYQHGRSSWSRQEPYSTAEIETFEEACIQQYKYGGVKSLDELRKWDVANTRRKLRVSHTSVPDGDEYHLSMPSHIQGCEAVTTRAMSNVKDETMRRFAEAHLWRFAGLQHSADGQFAFERYGSGHSRAGFLKIFADYDCPVSDVVIFRSLPWIRDSQNEDGSWGDASNKDAETLAVILVLKRIGLI